MTDIHSRSANLGTAPLYPTDRTLHLVIRNSNLREPKPAVSVDTDAAHTELVLFDPQREEETVLYRGKDFDTKDFDRKKSSSE